MEERKRRKRRKRLANNDTESKTLTEVELYKLQYLANLKLTKELVSKNLEKDLENTLLEIKTRKLEVEQLNLRSSILTTEIKNKNNKIQSQLNIYNSYKLMLLEKYSLKKNWGFDPDTGEIDKGE